MTTTHIGRVVFWMGGALLSFSAMAVSIRELARDFNVFEALSIRSAGGVLILLAIAALRPELRRQLGSRRLPLHVLRNTVHFGAQVGWAFALTVLPFATVFTLEFTTPLWVAVLAVIMLGERLTASRAASVALGFLGTLVVVRPGLEGFQPAALMMLGVAVGFAMTSILTKMLVTTDTAFTVVFWMNLVQLPLNLLGSDPWFPTRLDAGHAAAALGLVVSGVTSHYCLSNAFRWGDAIVVIPLDFLRIPLIAAIGWFFYAEPFDLAVFVGAALIIGGIVWNLVAEARPRPPPDAAPG